MFGPDGPVMRRHKLERSAEAAQLTEAPAGQPLAHWFRMGLPEPQWAGRAPCWIPQNSQTLLPVIQQPT